MIEIVQISVKDNIKCSSYKVEPLKRTPNTMGYLKLRRKDIKNNIIQQGKR